MTGLPKFTVPLEKLRVLYYAALRFAGLFINLEAVEEGALSSRLIEYPFVFSKLQKAAPERVLDVGCTDNGNSLAATLATLGWQVYGIDTRGWRYSHANFHFVKGDISKGTDFPDSFFDWAYAVSSIEHFGLSGRYGITEDNPEADFEAVAEIKRILKPRESLLLTLPYGIGGIVKPLGRVYNRERLLRMLRGWSIIEQQFYYLDDKGRWHNVAEDLASRTRTPGGVCVTLLQLENVK